MSKEFPLTPHRIRILEILNEGEIRDDPGGQAVRLLMERTGHQTTNALSGVLQSMEQAGLIARDTAGRRTYSIKLTTAGKRTLKSYATSPSERRPSVSLVEPAAFDYALLATQVLERALAMGEGSAERVAELETENAELRDRNVELAGANATLREQLAQAAAKVPPTILHESLGGMSNLLDSRQ